MPVNGRTFLILVNTGTVAVPVWTAVASQREATINEERNVIDSSHKDSDSRRSLPGKYGVTVDFQAAYVSADPGYTALQTAHRAGDFVQVAYSDDGARVESIQGVISSLQRSFPDDDVALADVSITSDGEWQAA